MSMKLYIHKFAYPTKHKYASIPLCIYPFMHLSLYAFTPFKIRLGYFLGQPDLAWGPGG